MAEARWSKEIAVEVVGGISYKMYVERPRRVEELLGFAGRWGERSYVAQGDQALTFAELRRAIAAKVAELTQAGIGAGDRVFVLGWNSPEWVVNFWACLSAGAVPVLANTWWSSAEIETGMALLSPKLILADASIAAKMPAGVPCGTWAVDPNGQGDVDAIAGNGGSEEDTAMIIFTSGTSGVPKAVVLSHRAVLARLHMTLHVTRKLPHQIDESAHDVTLLTGPLFHVGSMQALLRAVVVGDTIVLSKGRYDPKDVMELIERHKVNRWNAVPTMVSRLLDHPDVGGRDLSSLRSISIGGAPVHAELMQRMRTCLPSVSPRIPTGYGLTENGGQATAAAGSEDIAKLGSTGRPLPCVEISFLEHPGLPDGEILLRSPTQMSGYFGIDESPIDADGWLHTGDLGRLDEDGQLWITGRSKEMIIRGGENIAPVAVERALMTVPGVVEAVVFGIPHADLGEEVMAVVVTEGDLTVDEIRTRLRSTLASFAVPTRWRLQDEPLPTNHTGKVDKKLVSAAAREEIERASQSV
ncbi:class I adenylate-forming enzyme family protein [Sphingomonas natans]|uniref:class I adenylate-forming enzyme family protein n=1 Tax=Sphingomonas natans TaxID=3063330 RepID=UPI0026E1559D|nr:class I adenylate-forming enzyme family protein [Sphingomonas sp. BIUV-7]